MATSRVGGGSRAAGDSDERHVARTSWPTRKDSCSRRSCFWVIRRLGGRIPRHFRVQSHQQSRRCAVWLQRDRRCPKEGLFLLRKGEISEIARAGEPAPGGGVFDLGSLLPTTLNDRGDAGFAYLLDPSVCPSTLRMSHRGERGRLSLLPEHPHADACHDSWGDPAPGGRLFVGASFGANLNNRGDLVFAGIVQTERASTSPTRRADWG